MLRNRKPGFTVVIIEFSDLELYISGREGFVNNFWNFKDEGKGQRVEDEVIQVVSVSQEHHAIVSHETQ